MSFDVWLVAVKEGKFIKFPRIIVEKAFAPYIGEKLPGEWILSFPDGKGGNDYGGNMGIDDDQEIVGFTVNRPGGEQFYDVIFEVLRQTHSVFWWPGGAVVADAAMIPHLWPEMVAGVDSLTVVQSGAEILERVQNTV